MNTFTLIGHYLDPGVPFETYGSRVSGIPPDKGKPWTRPWPIAVFFLWIAAPLLRRSACFFECWLIGLFIGFFDHVNAFSDPSHDRYGHAVAQRLVTGTVRSVLLVPIWDIGVILTTLQYLAELWAEQENEEQPEDRGTFPFWLKTHVDDGRVEEPENRIYEVTVLVTTRQYVQFSAPEGMDSEEAKAWFDEHCDDEGAIVFEGSEEVADEELYMDGD